MSPGTPSVESGRKTTGSRNCVVDAAVDDVDPLESRGGAHRHDVVVDDQVAALDQLDAHLGREEDVLEVGGVVDARGEHHDGGVVAGRRRADSLQRLEQRPAVVVDPPDALDRRTAAAGPGSWRRGSRSRRRRRSGCGGCPRAPGRSPSPSRTRSMPATRQRAPLGTGMPKASGVKPSELSTSQRGTMPSSTICMPPTYRSSRNRLSAVTRCIEARPRGAPTRRSG